MLPAWMSRILSSPLAKDHRTGLEICKCIQSFLAARRAIFPLSSLPKPGAGQLDNLESQDEYGDGGLDLYDPTLLAFLADIEDCPDENAIVDHHASDVRAFFYFHLLIHTYEISNADLGCIFAAPVYLCLHAPCVQVDHVRRAIL